MNSAARNGKPGHTAGPWVIRYGNVSDADEGFGIHSEIEPEFGIVAECWPCVTTLRSRQTMRANARLIAAAPELLEACRRRIAHDEKIAAMPGVDTGPLSAEQIEALAREQVEITRFTIAAIRKAEGSAAR